jgi:hypothetical protein
MMNENDENIDEFSQLLSQLSFLNSTFLNVPEKSAWLDQPTNYVSQFYIFFYSNNCCNCYYA